MGASEEEQRVLDFYDGLLAGRRFWIPEGTLYEFDGSGTVYITAPHQKSSRWTKYEVIKDGNSFYLIIDKAPYKIRGVSHPEEATSCNLMLSLFYRGGKIRDIVFEEAEI